MFTTIIICISIIIIVFIGCHYRNKNKEIDSRKPQNNCNHDMTTIQTYSGIYSNEFLSTCSKCGYQKSIHYSGLN